MERNINNKRHALIRLYKWLEKRIIFFYYAYTPKFVLLAFYKIQILFLKLPTELKIMSMDYFKKDAKYASKLWIHLMAAHVKKVAIAYKQKDFLKNVIDSVTKNYTLRFSTPDHLSEIQQMFPGESKVIEDSEKRYQEITSLMLRLIKKNYLIDNELNLNSTKFLQDEIQSRLEIDYLSDHVNFNEIDYLIEIGAGYGRIPSLIIKNKIKTKYIIIDIPPALWISKTYLNEMFPQIRIAPYVSDLNSEKLKKMLEEFQIISLTPSQMKYLPTNLHAMVIAINCLQEMPPQTIESYFSHLSNVAQYFYIKAMKKPHDPWSDSFLRFDQYLENHFWKILHQRVTPFPCNYAEVILCKNK